MMTVRRAAERRYERRSRQQTWQTFFTQDRSDSLAGGFKGLEGFCESRVRPDAVVTHRRPANKEIITYVHQGRILHDDSTGRTCLVHAGEFQTLVVAPGVTHSEVNASRTTDAHIFQMWLRPPETVLEPSHDRRHFSVAERRGRMRVVASADARSGSLRIAEDALICSAVLDPGHHVVHELRSGRSAWCHVIHGSVSLGGIVLSAGDGAGVTSEVVSFTAQGEAEILLVDTRDQTPES